MSEILGLIEENDENDEGSNTFSHRHLAVQQRLRLELAQTIAERLVSAALLAESKSNVSVICLILPGAAV